MVNDSLPEGNALFPAYGAPPPTIIRLEVRGFVNRAVSSLSASWR